MYDAETYEHAGIPVRIVYDQHAENPYYSFDQASDLLYSGEWDFKTEPVPSPGYRAWYREDPSSAVMCRWLTMFAGYALAIPFHLADYGSGGLRAWLTTPDDEPASGYLVLTREAYDKEFGQYGMPLSGDAEHTAEKTCRAEFSTFASYVEGDVYGFIVAEDTSDEDSCWGFYGFDYCKEAANEAAEYVAEERARLRQLPWLPTFGNPIASGR
jgi:hypothetical protein